MIILKDYDNIETELIPSNKPYTVSYIEIDTMNFNS